MFVFPNFALVNMTKTMQNRISTFDNFIFCSFFSFLYSFQSRVVVDFVSLARWKGQNQEEDKKEKAETTVMWEVVFLRQTRLGSYQLTYIFSRPFVNWSEIWKKKLVALLVVFLKTALLDKTESQRGNEHEREAAHLERQHTLVPWCIGPEHSHQGAQPGKTLKANCTLFILK